MLQYAFGARTAFFGIKKTLQQFQTGDDCLQGLIEFMAGGPRQTAYNLVSRLLQSIRAEQDVFGLHPAQF